MSLPEFNLRFQNNEDCLRYLMDIKWGQGFVCTKCQSSESWKGKQWQNRRCKRCGYEESAKSGTLFHHIKFSLLKAFHIYYRVCVSKTGMSSTALSRELQLRQKTCWAFKRKILEAMVSAGERPLAGTLDMDECAIGSLNEEKPNLAV